MSKTVKLSVVVHLILMWKKLIIIIDFHKCYEGWHRIQLKKMEKEKKIT